MSAPNQLGPVVRRSREREGHSLRQAAKLTGVSPGQLSRIEAGAVPRPTVSTLIGIAHGLQRSPEPLFLLAGHLTLEQARPMIDDFLASRPDQEMFGVSLDEVRLLLDSTRDLQDRAPGARKLRALIGLVFVENLEAPPFSHLLATGLPRLELDRMQTEFLTASGSGVSGDPTDALAMFRLSPDLRELGEHWAALAPAQQRAVLAFARDQRRIAELEEANRKMTAELDVLRGPSAGRSKGRRR